MLKKVGIIIFSILLTALVFPLVLQNKAHVERNVVIHSSTTAIYSVLTDFNQFRSWDPWSPMEPEASFKIIGEGVGASYSWKGQKMGEGSMTIQSLKVDEVVEVQMNFITPFSSKATVHWKLNDMGNGDTEVVWEYDQQLGYFERYLGLTLDGMLGPQFEQGLARLKTRMEGNPA